MIEGLFTLLIFQGAGEFIVKMTHLMIPGPVVGMILFFIALLVKPSLKESVESLCDFITKHLSLFYIPAGVGVIKYFDLFGKYGARLVLTIVISTTVTIVSTALIFNYLLKSSKRGANNE